MNASPAETVRHDRWLTVPNAVCLLRLLAAPALIVLAFAGRRLELVTLFVLLAMSDWLDGKLARWLDQRSLIGPALDSMADLAMYGSLLAAAIVLEGQGLMAEVPWLALALISYLASGLYSLAKFGRWPTHHPRLAKVSWLLTLLGAVIFLASGWPWLLRLAMVGTTLANLQSIAITRLLTQWRADVPSVAEARRLRLESR